MKAMDVIKALGDIPEEIVRCYFDENSADAELAPSDSDMQASPVISPVPLPERKPRLSRSAAVIAIAASMIFAVGMGMLIHHFHQAQNLQQRHSAGMSGTQAETTLPVTAVTSETTITETTSATVPEPITVGDGVYQVFGIPDIETASPHCAYGTVMSLRGETAADVYGKRLDFSSVSLNPEYHANIIYCVPENQSAVYFLHFQDFYRSDSELKSPELLFRIPEIYHTDLIIDTLLCVPDSDLLFFRGGTGNGKHGIGSIQPDTKEIKFTPCDASEIVSCKAGVMLYDYDAALKHRSSTVIYWENGEVFQIPLKNAKESDQTVFISPNGKYICTMMNGTAKDGKKMVRCSVYDVRKGTFIKSFDRIFDTAYQYTNELLRFIGFDEENQCFYAENRTDYHTYRFDFGA